MFSGPNEELDFFDKLASLFTPTYIEKGTVLWLPDSPGDSAYLVEKGTLTASVRRRVKCPFMSKSTPKFLDKALGSIYPGRYGQKSADFEDTYREDWVVVETLVPGTMVRCDV